MKQLFFALLMLLCFTGCKKSSVGLENDPYVGQYFYSVKKGEVGTWDAMDIVVIVAKVNDKYEMRVRDKFVRPELMSFAYNDLDHNELVAKQHVEDGSDSRDIRVALNIFNQAMYLTYDVIYPNGGNSFHLNVLVKKK